MRIFILCGYPTHNIINNFRGQRLKNESKQIFPTNNKKNNYQNGINRNGSQFKDVQFSQSCLLKITFAFLELLKEY